ncbi:MAG TPA: ATP-binding protein, partial [Chloroflexota bacterium]|nr:ATP-binding protein [Chloroflexota bacterium]
MIEARPPLVLVSGAPGSGKTTLAAHLAPALALPLIGKDGVKERLYDTVGAPDVPTSQKLGAAAIAMLYFVAHRLLDAGVGVILESNFMRPLSDAELRALAARSRAVVVHCSPPPEVTARRYRERAEGGERHPGHHDLAAIPRLLDGLERGLYEPGEWGMPVLRVDTTAGYAPDLP